MSLRAAPRVAEGDSRTNLGELDAHGSFLVKTAIPEKSRSDRRSVRSPTDDDDDEANEANTVSSATRTSVDSHTVERKTKQVPSDEAGDSSVVDSIVVEIES
eukprot:Pompholyxophrys_punicea_v1_NODE_162_length_3055_cov_4.636000.p8 type:complete len:102 gc:universal NODE_162_length_3055_cov_4.636000:1721-2026(+)